MKSNMKIELIEKLAEAVHIQWADGRRADGWTLGPVRDDVKKETPCLIPYAELPDSEKEVDRATVRTTIQALEELGYEVVKSEG